MAEAHEQTYRLGAPLDKQQYVTLSALTGGFITLSDSFFVSPATEGAKRTVPSLAFLITHPGPINGILASSSSTPKKPFRMLFDLGLRSKVERYKPVMQKHLESRQPYTLEPGIVKQLANGGLTPDDIDAVMLSHVHYDHHGDPSDFPNATFLVGHGALSILEHGLRGKGSHQHFETDLFAHNKSVIELPDPKAPTAAPTSTASRSSSTASTTSPSTSTTEHDADSPWTALGPFDSALDLFGDGSVYVIDTPGHLPGHINLLCRLGPLRWICLCGDAFHDKRLLTGEKEVATWVDGDGEGKTCIHLDKEGAEESIRRLRQLQRIRGGEVDLIAAHDEGWLEGHKGALFPGLIR